MHCSCPAWRPHWTGAGDYELVLTLFAGPRRPLTTASPEADPLLPVLRPLKGTHVHGGDSVPAGGLPTCPSLASEIDQEAEVTRCAASDYRCPPGGPQRWARGHLLASWFVTPVPPSLVEENTSPSSPRYPEILMEARAVVTVLDAAPSLSSARPGCPTAKRTLDTCPRNQGPTRELASHRMGVREGPRL